LFERIMPNLKRVGLLTERVRPQYQELGALRYEDLAGDVMIDWAQLEKRSKISPLSRRCLHARAGAASARRVAASRLPH
jgi:hypothetical protein